jgi:hypothetical protein
MGGACGTYGGERKYTQGFGSETEEKRPLGTPKRRWENNIQMDLKEMGWKRVQWINLAEDRGK